MRQALPLCALLALVIAVAVALAVTSASGTEPSGDQKPPQDAKLVGEAGIPPPCYDTWPEAVAAGYPTPDPHAHGGVTFVAVNPPSTPGPPFDMTRTPPPPGFDSWEEVIDSWLEAKEQGLLDLDVDLTVPDDIGPPPGDCSSWRDFLEWIDRHVGDIIADN
jgi:hypothetical protein